MVVVVMMVAGGDSRGTATIAILMGGESGDRVLKGGSGYIHVDLGCSHTTPSSP